MKNSRITLLQSQAELLQAYLDSSPDGHEMAAIVLFRRLHREVGGLPLSDRYVAVDVIPFQKEWVTDSSATHIAYELKYLRDIFRRCDEEKLVFCFVHNHPNGLREFSETDESNEQELLTALTNRNGPDIHFVALLWVGGKWIARMRFGATKEASAPVRHLVVVGRPLKIHCVEEHSSDDWGLLARQTAAFGRPFVSQLRSLRVGIVGAGGTGSPTVTLLARAGVGELLIVDNDNLEKSNLNRVRGAGVCDVGRNKAMILQEFIGNLGLPTKVSVLTTRIDDNPTAIDALSSCDVIFGCTDDQIGREALNTCLYIYAQAYIDVGLGGQIDDDAGGNPYLRYHHGRVSTILPEQGECLFCQGVIKPEWIHHQYAFRDSPNMSEEEARDRYLEGGGEQAPGVGPFTSAIADYGVATLFDLIKPFRKFPPEVRNDFFRLDFVRMEFRSNQEKNDSECVYCRKREYLLLREKCRLNRPQLGKADVSN